jgi:hypothetical protein
MNKKQTLFLSLFSALVISSFGIMSAMAANSTSVSNQVDNFQKRFGITLTDEQKTQMQTKQTEAETKRAEELTKWQTMTLDAWKQQEILRINSTTQEQFDKMKDQHVNMLKNGKGGGMGGEFRKGLDKPAK